MPNRSPFVLAALVGALVLPLGSAATAPPAPAAAGDAARAAPSVAAEPQGVVQQPGGESIKARVTVAGWASAPGGVARVELRLDGTVVTAQLRDDAQATASTGRVFFTATFDPREHPAPPGIDRRELSVVVVGRNGRERLIGTKSVLTPAAFVRWRGYGKPDPAPFYLLPAVSGLELGAAAGLDTYYADYLSPTMRVGTRVPILYLRTTKGRHRDFVFDPDWNTERRCPSRAALRISDDSLNGVFRYSRSHRLPILFTLNGGIWADAACDVPDWDANDWLESDPRNCQWNERNEVVPDDYLKNLAGAFDSPELARALTLNVHARRVRQYKKRNLQQAARRIVAFARANPELFVGVTLDPDLYINPFFDGKAWFDYNPDTVRQFREWLAGTGPYGGNTGNGAPDLRKYRRAQSLTLAEVSRLAGRTFGSWSEVDPPRTFVREGASPFWQDPWVYEWEVFRRHLVKLHYDELSAWLAETGIPRERIWSAQGFMAPHPSAMPFALRIDSAVKNYDSGGMSVEGSRPAAGHLGAILYGAAARNDIRMEGRHSLFGAFAALDRGWAVIEYNSADLRAPTQLPDYAAAYRGLREMWNHGARLVSPMSWAGSNGRDAGKPGYDPFTAWRDTPLESAAKDFLLARANLPLGARLWTFGSGAHADADGWSAERGTITAKPGHLVLTPDRERRVTLLSPPELMIDTGFRLVLRMSDAGRLRVRGQGVPDGAWTHLAAGTSASDFAVTRVLRGGTDRLKIELEFPTSAPVTLARVALVPGVGR